MANVAKEIKKLNVGVLGLSETKWPGTRSIHSDRISMYYSRGSDSRNRNGIAVMLPEEIAKSVVDFLPLSDQIVLLILETTYRRMSRNK